MQRWKAHTERQIPEIVNDTFENINNPMLLWIELNGLFSQAASQKNEDLIKRIFDEADYFFNYEKNPKGDAYGTAVALAFIEHLLDEEDHIPYILRYMPKEDFIANKALLTHHNSESKYQAVLGMYE